MYSIHGMCYTVDGNVDFSALLGPILGGAVASGLMVVVILFLFVVLICIIKKMSRSSGDLANISESKSYQMNACTLSLTI